ncbi:MAG: hypothetical protein RIR26_2097 [Pseudomonadota bacterium]|jgi:hypothetical protein
MVDKKRWAVAAIALASAVLGSIGTQLYYESSETPHPSTRLNSKTDRSKPPQPLWNIKSTTEETEVSEQQPPAEPAAPPPPEVSLENPPQVKPMRDEVARDLHTTPQMLLRFAEKLASDMQGAFENQEQRYKVSRQLIACARAQTNEPAVSARALCLANFKRLKSKFPEELGPSFYSLLAELPEDILIVAGADKASEEK